MHKNLFPNYIALKNTEVCGLLNVVINGVHAVQVSRRGKPKNLEKHV